MKKHPVKFSTTEKAKKERLAVGKMTEDEQVEFARAMHRVRPIFTPTYFATHFKLDIDVIKRNWDKITKE
jgi:hypothetical protein